MKQKLWKNGKPYSQFRVVLYTTEGLPNFGCAFNDDCKRSGVNIRCDPPKSTQDGARNILCNLTANC